MMVKKVFRNFLIIVILVSGIGCDQISKNVIRQHVAYNQEIKVLGDYLIVTRLENTGAFLGMGDSIPRPAYRFLMIFLPLIVIGYALYYLFGRRNVSNLLVVGISLAVGGGLGNICDRIIYGSVTDFLYFNFVIFHTGVVNIADILVTTGFFIIVYESYINRKKSEPKPVEK